MFETQTLITYLAASIAIILAPGPAQALVLARSISDGKKSGILTGIGLNGGTIFHALAAALGLSTILATSAAAFAVVKYAGAIYLVYLGIRALLTKKQQIALANPVNSANPRQTIAKAVVTGILNPKIALFFLAFLPQFIDPERGSVFMQFLILGVILAALDILYESLLALITGSLSNWLTNSPKFTVWRQRVTGAVLFGLGVRLALTERN
jgi:threonine/homoserine/homoserine lactone efflux protein